MNYKLKKKSRDLVPERFRRAVYTKKITPHGLELHHKSTDKNGITQTFKRYADVVSLYSDGVKIFDVNAIFFARHFERI